MEAVAGEPGERLGHERRRHAGLVGQRVDHVAEEDDPVGGGERVVELEVLLELPVGILVVVGVVRPPELVHVPRDRGEVVEHAGEALGVVAGHVLPVERVGHLDATLEPAPDEVVLRFDPDHELHAPLVAQAFEGVPQHDPRGVWPWPALDLDVAHHHRDAVAPRELHVAGRVRRGDHVGISRALAHGPDGEAGEPCSADDHVHRRRRHELGAGTAVHVHEHRQEELDAVLSGPSLEHLAGVSHR